MRGLACAALNRGLRSILMFDVSPVVLRSLADLTVKMLQVVTGDKVVLIQLGTTETEDDIWGQWGMSPSSKSPDSQKFPISWKPGLLGSVDQVRELRLVLIPDLTRLSLSATRACVSVMGEEIVHLERHEQQQLWHPNLCWLAGCAKEEVGLVSPHLLDRFALRLTGREINPQDRVANLLAQLEQPASTQEFSSIELPPQIATKLQAARQHRPQLTDEAASRTLDYISAKVYSLRRELALLRLAIAHAKLEGDSQVNATHVERAAQTIGLKPVAKSPKKQTPSSLKEPSQPESSETPQQPYNPDDQELPPQSPQSEPPNNSEPVYASNQTEAIPSTSFTQDTPAVDPYPEDNVAVQREAFSLRLPPRRFRARAAIRGPIIGVEPAKAPHDIALVSTLLEAAKFQPIRHSQVAKNGLDDSRLILWPTDLRCYRRAPVAEQMLALVLDYTCLRNCKWQETLLPYLSWAYVERASICLVQVGASGTFHELRAERIVERNILVPSVIKGIEAGGGKATPLAHGLDLALQTLRHTLQHGRSKVQQALLVVVSDGRGNVPLAASYSGKITAPTKRQGVEDALQVADRIRLLHNLDSVLLNPQPKHYTNLPLELAQALNAKVVDIPPLETWDVEEL